MEEVKELTPTGKLKRPSYETVTNWVKDSWNAVDVNLIKWSFKCCGISNNRNGSEDDWIFNYDRLGQGQADRLNDGVEIPLDKEDEEVQESEKDEDEEDEEVQQSEKDEDEENEEVQ